jgi:triosephosphate isomerase (TIM)
MRYVLANWKMHTTVGEGLAWLHAVQEGLRRRTRPGRAHPLPIVCPPFVSLEPMRSAADRHLLRLGAQTCHWEREGPYTGEISAAMLQDVVDYVLVGHSARRAMGETDEQVARKVAAVAEVGLVPILFVGEDRPEDDAVGQTEERLRHGLSRVDPAGQRVLIVYEPVWAVGAAEPADADHVRRVVEHLKSRLSLLGVSDPEVLYGGTVSPATIDRFLRLEVLDGVGATRASLDPDGFLAMVDRVASVRADAPAEDRRGA